MAAASVLGPEPQEVGGDHVLTLHLGALKREAKTKKDVGEDGRKEGDKG